MEDLLDAPAPVGELRPLCRPAPSDATATVTSVALAEEVTELAQARAGALVILGARASAISGYRLDLAARLAVDRGVAAIVLRARAPFALGASTSAIAREGGMCILLADPAIDLAALVLAIDQQLSAGADRELARVHAVLRMLRRRSDQGTPLDALTAAVGDLLGTPVELREQGADDVAASLVIDGQAEGTIVAAAGSRVESQAREIAVELAAAAAARIADREERRHEAPGQTRADFLTELLAVDARHVERMIDRSRALGLQLERWHTALRLELDARLEAADGDEAAAFDLARSITRVTMNVARESGGMWHRAHAGDGLLLIKTERSDPGPRGPRALVPVAERILAEVRARHPRARVRCGIGASHGGAGGLRRSAGEARTALAADDADVACFDALGMRRILVEWAATTTAADTIDTLLHPLDELGPQRSAEAIRTLRAFLDCQGSLTRAAATLHLHRNSLSYRLNRIRDRLDVDLDDPEQWLALQLACHARMLD